jgi:hypothetical protein
MLSFSSNITCSNILLKDEGRIILEGLKYVLLFMGPQYTFAS